jgi:hypothetical protein
MFRQFTDKYEDTGRAYCSLPLPVKTQLPVHCNGYFELSSNRRDIWYGTDMDGAGRVRSDWNVAILKDAIAPSYIRLLLLASQRLGPAPDFFNLWPQTIPSAPWNNVTETLFQNISSQPLFHVDFSAPNATKWLKLSEVIFPAQDSHMSDDQEQILCKALLIEQVPLVSPSIPDSLYSMLVAFHDLKHLQPFIARDTFRKASTNGAVPKSLLPSSSVVAFALEQHAQQSTTTTTMNGSLEVGKVLLEYCASDLTDSFAGLLGLRVIPMVDHAFGMLGSPQSQSGLQS